jgi:Tol biopolymer transport system component
VSVDEIEGMISWQEVETAAGTSLTGVTRTERGVQSLEWIDDGDSLAIQINSDQETPFGPRAIPIIVDMQDQEVWSPPAWGDSPCYSALDWSSDRRQVAFLAEGELRVASEEGEIIQAYPLPAGVGAAYFPEYSPDGSRISLLAERFEENQALYDLWILDTAGGAWGRTLKNTGFGQSTWSPSNRRIAHLGESTPRDGSPGTVELWSYDFDSGEAWSVELGPLPGSEGCLEPPEWLLDESLAASVPLTPGVWTVDPEGNAERIDLPLRDEDPGDRGDQIMASPDGRYLLFSVAGAPYLMDVQSQEVLELGSQFEVPFARWSPDSSKFLAWDRSGGGLRSVDAASGEETALAEGGIFPSWSPDGGRIAYWQAEPGGYSLWSISPGGGAPTRLTSASPEDPLLQNAGTPAYDLTPRWSPDGDALAFVSIQEAQPEAYMLVLGDTPD